MTEGVPQPGAPGINCKLFSLLSFWNTQTGRLVGRVSVYHTGVGRNISFFLHLVSWCSHPLQGHQDEKHSLYSFSSLEVNLALHTILARVWDQVCVGFISDIIRVRFCPSLIHLHPFPMGRFNFPFLGKAVQFKGHLCGTIYVKSTVVGTDGNMKSGRNLVEELTIWHEVTYRNNFN